MKKSPFCLFFVWFVLRTIKVQDHPAEALSKSLHPCSLDREGPCRSPHRSLVFRGLRTVQAEFLGDPVERSDQLFAPSLGRAAEFGGNRGPIMALGPQVG